MRDRVPCNKMLMKDILGMTKTELRELAVSMGESAFRGEQLYGWMMKGREIADMKNLPASFKEKLAENAEYRLPSILEKYVSAKDGTVKYLMELTDGECVECVLMKYDHGTTLCVSSQAGCRMGCSFCASTLRGKTRDLTASEILGQVLVAARDSGDRVDGVVMMGIGEPFDNYDNTVKFLRLVSAEGGPGIGLRHISVSTCGLVDGIKRLAGEGLPVTLSISLHAYNDDVRSSLMPINRKWCIAELMDACRYYFDTTGRRISFEYTLIAGENDSAEGAEALGRLLRKEMGDRPCHVNLILLNPVKETGLTAPGRQNSEKFCRVLEKCGINATIRRRLGGDIDASCGQLRLRRLDDGKGDNM